MTQPTCHPERKYFARGICQPCYRGNWRNGERTPRRIPKCHPERTHKAHGMCNECYSKPWENVWKEKNPELKKQKASAWRIRRLELDPDYDLKRNLRQYNLSPVDYYKLLEVQGGFCKICKMPPNKKRLHVDHDHKTGRIRGLLCTNCNTGLGHFKENSRLLEEAINYLK